MSDFVLSDEDLKLHKIKPKIVTQPAIDWTPKPGHIQKNHSVKAKDGSKYLIYLRQNSDDYQDFSCGLALIKKGGGIVSLVRYNGSSHVHGEIHYDYHIHYATANAVESGRKIDSYALPTNRYRTLDGALACLIEDYHVSGISSAHD